VTWEIGSDAAALSDLFAIDNSLVVPVRWEGVAAVVLGSLDEDEHHRRQLLGMGAVRDYRRVEQMYEELLDLAACERRPDHAQGMGPARPPLVPDTVVVLGVAPESTVRRASYFAPVARRIALLTRTPRDVESAQLRAAWLEVGLVVKNTQGELSNLTAPGERHGHDEIFSWWFAEAVYDAHLRLSRIAHRHPALR